jgi:hypothetical protein
MNYGRMDDGRQVMAIAHRGELKKLGFKSGYHDTISEESPL